MFVVEDGTGLPTSVSYVGVEWANEYFLVRGAHKWAEAANEDKQYALIQATDFIDVSYEFPGSRATAEQALAWPRTNATNKYGTLLEGVPGPIQKAVVELALRALDAPLLADIATQGWIKKERVEGVVTIEYGGDGAYPMRSFPYIDRFLMTLGIALSKTGGLGNRPLQRV